MSHKASLSFRALLAYEVRQLWRSFLPWLLALAVPALFILVGQWRAPALERHVLLQPYLAFEGMGLGAFAAWTWQRGRRNGSDEILLAWPLPSWQVGLARTLALGSLTLACWLAAVLPSLAYTALSYATAARAAGVALPLARALGDGGLIALSLAASFLGAQALGQIAGALVPGLPALALLILYRAAVLFIPRLVAGTLQWPYGLLATPEFMWNGYSRLAAGLQTRLYTGLFLAHQGFWVLGGLGTLVLVVLLFRARRDAPRWCGRLLAGTALLATVGAALPFIAAEHCVVDSHWRAIAEYGEAVKPPLRLSDALQAQGPASGAPVAVPVSYELVVDLTRPPLAEVQATVELQAPASAPLEILTLTLRRSFEIDAVSLDGAVVPVERQGDTLRIHPPAPLAPGQVVTVTVSYHGRVEDWRLDGSYEAPQALASRSLVLLPAGWGWYPAPGEHRLTWEIGMSSRAFRALADRAQPFNAAEPEFDIAVQALPAISALAGFSSDGPGRWRLQEARNQVSLLGGPWWEQQAGDVRFLVPFEELDTWQTSSEALQRLLAAAADWTGIAPLTLVPSPLSLLSLGDNGLLDEQIFGRIYQPGSDRDRLAWGIGWWGNRLLSQQARQVGGVTPVGGPVTPSPQQEASALRAYAVTQIFADALGEQAAQSPLQINQTPSISPSARAWAERTPLAAQKEALRRVFRAAQVRQLTTDDLTFLQAGER